MKRLFAAFTAIIVIVAAVPPAAAATKTIPATAFKPSYNFESAGVAVMQMPLLLAIMDNPWPTEKCPFWAAVKLPVGARVARVTYWYMDAEQRGTKLSLQSGRWGASHVDTMAEIVTTAAATDVTRISTSAITHPEVTAGTILILVLELPQGGGCGGVKIDYEP